MGNAAATGAAAPHVPSAQLRLRRGKKSTGCPFFLSEQASTWEAITLHEKFRPYVQRHLLDEGFICSVLEHGEREHALLACEGVLYYKYMEEAQRLQMREKHEAWERAAGAGLTVCEALIAESAFGNLQLARPPHAYGFLPTLQRRLAVLRELGAAIADEHRSRCRPFHMRVRSSPPPTGDKEQGNVRLSLMMNAVALESLSTLASLATALQALPSGDGNGRTNVDLIRAPFAMLADMMMEFPAQSLFDHWSPPPAEPEKRVSVDPDTATASCSASLARLAVTGGLHVGWKSTAPGASVVTWQVALSEPATDLTSVKVQWGAGDPATGTDQNALPLALSIEASVDGGKEWQGITGGDEAVDVALAHKLSLGSSQHRYPVSLLAFRRKREAQRAGGELAEDSPAVTHVRLKMKGASVSRPGGSLRIYDVAISTRDSSASPSDVMTVLRQVQAFLLAQHSQEHIDLRAYILRALLGVCQASCALEFELDLIRVYVDMERTRGDKDSVRRSTSPRRPNAPAAARLTRGTSTSNVEQQEGLQQFVSTLLAAASRAKRLACRQNPERIIRDAGFDPELSSKWVVIDDGGQLVSSADSGHSHSLVHQCLRRGIWSWELALERESSGDETTCVGVAVNPVTNSCYEESHQMWMVRCYSGETYSNGGRRNHMACKIHPLDVVRLTLNCEAGTLSLEVNGVDQGVVFTNVPQDVHPAVCFYGITKSVRLVELKRVYGDSDSDDSDSDDETDKTSDIAKRADEDASLEGAATPAGAAAKGHAPDKEQGARAAHSATTMSRSRRAARRAEENAIAETIRAATEESPSVGLLAGLANFAQWYVPRGDEIPEGRAPGGIDEGADTEGASGERTIRVPDAALSMSADTAWSVGESGTSVDLEAWRHLRRLSVDGNTNDAWRLASPRSGQSSLTRRTMSHWPSSPTRAAGGAMADTTSRRSRPGDSTDPRRMPTRVTAPPDFRGIAPGSHASVRGASAKPLALEEPYIIQPTAAVFQKLYDLLVRSLSLLEQSRSDLAASAVLSILQIMRANFCRLVDANVDPAEMGLVLAYDRQQHGVNEAADTEEDGRGDGEKLLPNILRCLQGIMLQQEGDHLLRRATVDTFSSGLPLLMPRVEDRLHLLLGLVWHLQSQHILKDEEPAQAASKSDVDPESLSGSDAFRGGLAQIPRERVILLRDLLKHFARTESILQLLTLFEEDEAERTAVSDLLELMLTSMVERACPRGKRDAREDEATVGVSGASPGYETHWEHLVACGAGGTTLNFSILDACQQHLLCMVLNHDRAMDNPHELLLCQYGQCLLQVCCRALSDDSASVDRSVEDIEGPWWQLVGVLLPPFLHALCLCADLPKVAEGMLPSLICLSEVLSNRIRRNSTEAAVATMAEEILRQAQLTNPEEGLALAPSGWHPVRASFEVDKESMTSFTISEDGQLYSALTSSNTCALVDVGVSQGKAAWEFLLEDDSPGDECSVFGIATRPPYSRCYNSSQSLWMRRAYNGVLYNRGRQLPASQSMSKIHPGDVVRCEVDMDEGTVRFSVNGEKQDGGFDGVEGEVFPCAGSYRSGVTIRLLKMEIMGGIGPRRGGSDDGTGVAGWDPTEMSWMPAPCSKVTRGGLVSIDKKAIEIKRMNTANILQQAWSSGSVTRSHDASRCGASGSDKSAADSRGGEAAGEKAAPNASSGSEMQMDVREVADSEAWDWVSVRATRGFAADEGKHAVEMEVTPVGSGRRRTAGNSQASSSEKKNSLRRYPMVFGLCTGDAISHERPMGLTEGSWGWWTDGSLRAHGEILAPSVRCEGGGDDGEAGALFGEEFLPLKPFDVITMVANTLEGTVRYLVNGVDVGIAFGPPGSGAVCELADGKAPFNWHARAPLFPSCSLTNEKQVVQLRPGGTLGTQLWPLSVDLQKTVASLAGRLCATMIAGTPQDEAEVALEPWLRSLLLSGGVEASEGIMGQSAWRSLGRRSWREAWKLEQEGQLLRTRSFMAWGSPASTLRRSVAPHDESHLNVYDREGAGEEREAASPPLSGTFRVTVRILRATTVPQGLVLWPDDPFVRLSIFVGDHEVGFREEVLTLSKTVPAGDGGERAEEGAFASKERAGQVDHVFELKLRSESTEDSDSRDMAGVWTPLLRVEVLMGRVTTARSELALAAVLAAAPGDVGGPGTFVLKLVGGGEIVLAVGASRVDPSSVGAQGDATSDVKDESRDASDRMDTHRESKGVCIGTLARDVATVGSRRCARRGSGNSDDFSVGANSGDDATSALAMRRFSMAALESGPLTGHASSFEPAFGHLTRWLSLHQPDPPFLRAALEKNDSYSFPSVEAPFVAALLKHGGLVGEASNFVDILSAREEEERPGARHTWYMPRIARYARQVRPLEMPLALAVTLFDPVVLSFPTFFGNHSPVGDMPYRPRVPRVRACEWMPSAWLRADNGARDSLPTPSKDMAKLWGRVRQLRAYLRTQKQEYKVLAADGFRDGGSTKHQSSAADNSLEADARNEEKDETLLEEKAETKEDSAPSDNHMAGGRVDRDAFPETFADLCAQLTERANFLLQLSPSTAQSPAAAAEGTSVLMRHLAEELSDLPTPPPARLRSRLLRWRSEDRGRESWKGVLDALRVQSQLRRHSSVIYRPRARSLGHGPVEAGADSSLAQAQVKDIGQMDVDSVYNSGDDSDGSENWALVDDETAGSAAMQACTLYITTGGAVAPPRLLKTTLRSRSARAAMRTFGLEAMSAMLRTLAPNGRADMASGAPSAVQEALIFLRPAFQGLRVKRSKEGREVGIASDERDPRHHYLKGLEGCSASLLAGVQSAFEDLYGLLRTLLDCSLRTGQPGLAHVLMTSWALDFESRDYRFLAHESGILPTLQAMVTLSNTTTMATSALEGLQAPTDAKVEGAHAKEAPFPVSSDWTPWSLESIRGGLLKGTLMARDLARHISNIPATALPNGFLERAGLHGCAADIIERQSIASLVRRYSALLRAHVQHTEAKLEKAEQEAALERKRLEDIARERVGQMVQRGVPHLDERETRKAPEVHLTALCSWATVPMVESVACTFARGVVCASTPSGELSTALPPNVNTGNYFEVTVMNPGEKTTIGVGLADPDVFPATKQMPGWVDRSYGYHGDDGRKFGRGKTDSIWPTWVDGDVIGCGFDATRGAIWYTRNGKLLGDGFVSVYESNLVPVVGFHSNGESVRVNFGLAPFAYEGREVLVARSVLAERELLKRETEKAKAAAAAATAEAEKRVRPEEMVGEEKTETTVAEEKEAHLEELPVLSIGRLGKQAELSPEVLMPSMKVLQRGALSLLRFLVAVSMRQASLGTVEPAAQELQGSVADAQSRAMRGREEPSTPKAAGRAAAANRRTTTAVRTLEPTRERSMYGTPFKQMQMHVDSLHQDIFDLVLRELRLGALSLEHIAGATQGRADAVEPGNTTNRPAFDGISDLNFVVKSSRAERAVKPEMKRSYSQGNRRSTGSAVFPSLAWKEAQVTSKIHHEREDLTAESLGLLALEFGEVEPHMFHLLAMLCSLRQYPVAKAQLEHPSSLRSIISLLRVGSPRVQRCVLLLLGSVLPMMEPAVVDQCLPSTWADQEQTSTPTSSKSGARKDQENGGPSRPPQSQDGLVGVLFASVREAYSPPLTLPGQEGKNDVIHGAPATDGKVSGKEKTGFRSGGDLDAAASTAAGQSLLAPGCDQGFGAGVLDLRLAEQCGCLLRDLYKEPAWKELIARKLLLSIRTAAHVVREASGCSGSSVQSSESPVTSHVGGVPDIISDAVAALAIIKGSSGVLYPGATVQARSGALGAVVHFSPGDAEATVVFDGDTADGCETALARDLEVVRVGFEADPDTPAQPVVAQLLALLGALLQSDEVVEASKVAGAEDLTSGVPAILWSRLLSQTLMAVLHLSRQCGDAVVAACQEGDVVAHVLPALYSVAVCPVQLPALVTGQELSVRWRAAHARMLSAVRMGTPGFRTLQPVQRRALPPLDPPASTERSVDRAATSSDASKLRLARSPSTGRDMPSAEESREEALMRPQRHTEYADSLLEVARVTRQGGRGRLMTLGDPLSSWGRGWGPAIAGRRAIGTRGALDWVGRSMREEDDSRRDPGRRRTLRSDAGHRASTRGRRAASVESRLDPRRTPTRVLHEHDRLGGFAEVRDDGDDDSGALLVEFNDRTDEVAAESHGLDVGSAGSADSGDTSQDGEEEESSTGIISSSSGPADRALVSLRPARPTSPSQPPYRVFGDGSMVRASHRRGGEHVEAEANQASPPLPCFPVSHVLEFDDPVREERQTLSARLGSEAGVSHASALSAVEAFGEDVGRTRRWLQALSNSRQGPGEALKARAHGAFAGSDMNASNLHEEDEASAAAADSAIVAGLIGVGESDAASGAGEAAGVPSAEEGWNLWEAEGEGRASAAPTEVAFMENGAFLCEHDLIPALGLPRSASGAGGPSGTVTSSFLAREVDLLVPGSLVMATAGEGYAPDDPCPCGTIASEMESAVGSSQAEEEVGPSPRRVRRGHGVREPGELKRGSDGSLAHSKPRPAGIRDSQGAAAGSVADGEEVLVEIMDAETGLCLGKRVALAELRHSTSFFGLELDAAGTTVPKLLHDTDIALSVVRARRLLVRLIHSLPTPAIAAAGGPDGLIKMTRLLVAKDLAKGTASLSMGSALRCDESAVDQSAVATTAVEGEGEAAAVAVQREKSQVDPLQLDGDCLLKVLWRKVLDSPGQWVSKEEQGAGCAALGEKLAQEVLNAFHMLTATPQIMLSGDWDERALSIEVAGRTKTSPTVPVVSPEIALFAAEGVQHESPHPLCTPLSYGGHIKVDPRSHGMVVKLDSRSRTSSELLQLQFFSSEADMLSGRNPLRVMHGHAVERASRARAKGMEFFKIEEADSSFLEVMATPAKGSLPSGALDRLTLPPALARQSSTSTTASLGSPTPLSSAGSSRRPVLTSRAMTRAMYEVHNQMMVKRKAMLKDVPVPSDQGNAFRSFALPGVSEIWFRFHAPPGAEKPPLRIISLAGPLDFGSSGTVETGVARVNKSESRSRSDLASVDDTSQEAHGLQSLFPSFDNAIAPEIPSERDAPNTGEHAEDKSTTGERKAEHVKAALPGCLATAADVVLTSGKWFYEATVESLAGGSSDGAHHDGCLLRLGWARPQLAASVQLGGIWKVDEGSLAWDTSSSRADVDAEAAHDAAVVASEGTAAPAGHEVQPGPLLRTGSWLSESVSSSSPPEDRSDEISGDSTSEVEPSSSAAGGEDAPASSASEAQELSKVQAAAKSLVFPILGSDSSRLGFGLGEEGFVWLGGRPRFKATGRVAVSDVIGCAFDVDSGEAWFAVNGQWSNAVEDAGATSVKPFGWETGSMSAGKGVKPSFSVRGRTSLAVNFGSTPFKYPPPGSDFKPVILRDIQPVKEERPPVGNQVGDNRVAFTPETHTSITRSPSKSTTATTGGLSDNWGFRFVVDPLRGVQYMVVRELELVCRFGAGFRGGSASLTQASAPGSQALSIWRPKAPPGWFSVGDVASRGLLPPAGAVVVRTDPTGCVVSKPAKFRVVHQDKATGYVVWRPVARQGQVSLGDFACVKKASKGIMAGAVRCVAAWAVEPRPVIQCLWQEDKQSGTQAIWAVENGLGTFFGSQTGGRLGKKEVVQGSQSRSDRHKRKKKKKKKKAGSVGGDSSDEDESERVKVHLGVGEGYSLKGVSASCITNEWCQESDVVASQKDQHLGPRAVPEKVADANDEAGSVAPSGDLADGDPGQSRDDEGEKDDSDAIATTMDVLRAPRPSVSWASWLLTFLLNQPRLRRLAMRASLFRTLVAYLRSPGAPHRLRMVPLLTLLVRSHAEFEDGPPPLEELSGLLAAVLRECDKLTCSRGPGSAAWRPSDSPGGLQLETRWANGGLLLLADLALATRRAQDDMRGMSTLSRQRRYDGGPTDHEERGEAAIAGEVAEGGGKIDDGQSEGSRSDEADSDKIESAVQVSVPPFGTRLEEGALEEGGEDETDEAEQSLADRLQEPASLSPEDRALLEVDLRNALLPETGHASLSGEQLSESTTHRHSEEEPQVRPVYPSQCLHHLLEITDSLRALRDGWPAPSTTAAQDSTEATHRSPSPSSSLDGLLCEAWMDAVGPAAVVESAHPFRKGAQSQTLHFPGADELLVFLDPRSSMDEDALLVLVSDNKTLSFTGRNEAAWSDVVAFRGESITYTFYAPSDGDRAQRGCLVDNDSDLDDWGFRFTVVAKGPVWEVTTLEGDARGVRGGVGSSEASVEGAISLVVELDQVEPLPRDCGVEVMGYGDDGTLVHAGFLTNNRQTAVYVEGDRAQLAPSRAVAPKAAPSGGGKSSLEEGSETAMFGKSVSAASRKVEPAADREGEELSDHDVMPEADAKLERLPSNCPVLRPWGEAAGVERRWRSASRGGNDSVSALPGAVSSYASIAATVEVGDSDADSKDGSSNASSGEMAVAPWSRRATLNDVIAAGVPALSAVSSETSEAQNRWPGSGLRELEDVPTPSNASGRAGNPWRSRDGRDRTSRAAPEGPPAECKPEAVAKDMPDGSTSAVSSKPAAGAEAKDAAEESLRDQDLEQEAASTWEWAVKVQAAAMTRKARLRLYLKQRQSLPHPGPSLEDARRWMRDWTPEMDRSLLELLGVVGTKAKEEATAGRVTDSLNPWCCRLTRAEARFHQQRLAAVPSASLHIRAAFLLRLNDRIERVLPVIDLASTHEASLGWQLREMNHVILPHIKNAVLEAALTVTQGPGDGVAVTLDNMKAMMSRDRGERDLATSQCVFAQAYRQLSETEPKLLRTVWDGERVFQINFVGEDGVDAGGVFREGMSRMVEDLFSPDFDLFIQCPNGRQAIGQNNEKFVPNPQYTSPLALSMLRFTGRLMGLSLRTRLCLPFRLPGIIWKRMLGMRVGFEDLQMVDTIICRFISAIETCRDDGVSSDEDFREKFGDRFFFTCTGGDGLERELAPGGAARRVTFHNRLIFCRMVKQARMHEFDAQATAMAEGLADIVPMKVLRLFTAAQLEIAVAGQPEFDLSFWKQHTDYKGFRPDDVTVELFWKVMESMSPEDQSGFVRFAWGRSRLPPKAFWRVNMKLLRRNTTEESLPVSHTCFFSVELPPYTTEERMRKGLLTAIHFGMGGILNA